MSESLFVSWITYQPPRQLQARSFVGYPGVLAGFSRCVIAFSSVFARKRAYTFPALEFGA